MTNSDLKLPKNPTLTDFCKYSLILEQVRGFEDQTVKDKCILLGEEVGELLKAIRHKEGMVIDKNKENSENISLELADVFGLILAIANKYEIDLEKAFREKEEINKKRIWKKNNA